MQKSSVKTNINTHMYLYIYIYIHRRMEKYWWAGSKSTCRKRLPYPILHAYCLTISSAFDLKVLAKDGWTLTLAERKYFIHANFRIYAKSNSRLNVNETLEKKPLHILHCVPWQARLNSVETLMQKFIYYDRIGNGGMKWHEGICQ